MSERSFERARERRERQRARSRRRGSKAAAQRVHAFRRAFERYGLVLDDELRAEALRQIRGPQDTCVGRQSCRVSLHDVTLEGRVVRVVYDRERGEVVSFLPMGASEDYAETS